MEPRLFKEKALPVVIQDIADSLERASLNSARALRMLYLVGEEYLWTVTPNRLAALLAEASFRVRADSFPPEELETLLARIGPQGKEGDLTESTWEAVQEQVFWNVYAYLLCLFPCIVKRPRVHGRKWSDSEYRALEVACHTPLFKVHPKEENSIFAHYGRLDSVLASLFFRRSKLLSALEGLQNETAKRILNCFPRTGGQLCEDGFHEMMNVYLPRLRNSFAGDIAYYYAGLGHMGFFENDSIPLPRHIDPESDEEEWLRKITRGRKGE